MRIPGCGNCMCEDHKVGASSVWSTDSKGAKVAGAEG